MSTLSIEPGNKVKSHICDHCGKEYKSVHGFVYEDDIPRAVYLAALYTGHTDKLVCLGIGIGEWKRESPDEDRTAIGIDIRATDEQFQMAVTDASMSPWRESKTLGKMLNRKEALDHPQLPLLFQIADQVVISDPVVSGYLNS